MPDFQKLIKENLNFIIVVISAATAIVNVIKLDRGDQTLLGLVIAVFAFIVLGGILAYVGFSKQVSPISEDRRIPKYPKWHKWARGSLLTIIVFSGYGYFQYRGKVERVLANCPPHNDKQFLIMVDAFIGPNSDEYGLTDEIINHLKGELKDTLIYKTNRKFAVIEEGDANQLARDFGKKCGADLVLWGKYLYPGTTVSLTTYVEITGEFKSTAFESSQTYSRLGSIADLDSFKLQTQLATEMSALTQFIIGVAHFEHGHLRDAIDSFTAALDLGTWVDNAESSNKTYLYYYQGLSYFYLGRIEDALDSYNVAIKLNPNFAPVYNNRGIIYYYQEKLDKALADYEKSIRLNPQGADAFNNRGIIYYKFEQSDKAINDYSEAIRLDPQLATAYTGRGIVYEELGKYECAFDDYGKAIAVDPQFIDAYYNRGIAFEERAWYHKTNNNQIKANVNFIKAIFDYSKVIRLNPLDGDAYFNRGLVFYEIKAYKYAIADYAKVIDLYQSMDAYYNRGLAYKVVGRNDKARSDFQYVRDNSNDPELIPLAEKELEKLTP